MRYAGNAAYSEGSGPITVELFSVGSGAGDAPSLPEHEHRSRPARKAAARALPPEPRALVAANESDAASDAEPDEGHEDHAGGSGQAGHDGAGGAPGVLGEEEVDVPARLVSTPHPVFPLEMEREGVEGLVVLFLVLDDRGHVADARVTTSAGPAFDAAALKAAWELVFTPAEKRGRRVPVHIHWKCRFRLDG